MASQTSTKSVKVARKGAANRVARNPKLLSGGNPQIAKADGVAALSTRDLIHQRREEGRVPEQPQRRRAALRGCLRLRDPDRVRISCVVWASATRATIVATGIRRPRDPSHLAGIGRDSRERHSDPLWPLSRWSGNSIESLTAAVPGENLVSSDVGTVVHIYADGKAFETEFMALDGQTAAVATDEASAVRPVTGRDISHSRHLQGC